MSILQKSFINHKGIDLNSSDLVRSDDFASGMKNAQYLEDGSIEKRKGYRPKCVSDGGLGMAVYEKINRTTGNTTQELLTLDTVCSRYTESTLTVAYTGSGTTVTMDVYFDTTASEYKLKLEEDTVVLLDYSLGTGTGSSPGPTLATLKIAIDALADFGATITGATTTLAAYLDLVRDYDIKTTDAVTTAGYWTAINTTVASPFAGSDTNKNSTEFENISSAQTSGNLYFGNGYDYVQKYDGQTLYRAGMPQPDAPTTANGAAGNPSGTYSHALTYIQYDNSGNLVEGNQSNYSADLVTGGSFSIDVTIDNIVDGSGFNTNCAIVDGAGQTGVTTITVDDGAGGSHTMKAGDTAYFWDNNAGVLNYVERTLVSVAATTITFVGAVDVLDGYPISNNLRIGVWRNQAAGTAKFLVAEIPNNSFNATQVYNDDLSDIALAAKLEFVEPYNDRSLPPNAKYLTAHSGLLVLTGTPANPNYVRWSDLDGPEYFPADTNIQVCQSINGDVISGVASSNEVLTVFEEKATHVLQGDFGNALVRRETLTTDIGCVSHHTIQDFRGILIFLSKFGFCSMNSGQLPQVISHVLESEIVRNDEIIDEDLQLVFKRAIGVNYRPKRRYVCYIPSESVSGSSRYGNSNSRIFTYDIVRDSWLEWDNMNMLGGGVVFNDTIYFTERRYDSVLAVMTYHMYKQMNRGDNWDYQDHVDPVDFEYKTNWYSFLEPTVFKKYNRLKMFGISKTDINEFTLTVDIEINFIQDAIYGTLELEPFGGDGYGISAYGTSGYGDIIDPGYMAKIGPIKAKSLRFNFKNDEDIANVNMTGWELEYEAPYQIKAKE